MEQEDADNEFIGALVGAYRDELPQCELCGTTLSVRSDGRAREQHIAGKAHQKRVAAAEALSDGPCRRFGSSSDGGLSPGSCAFCSPGGCRALPGRGFGTVWVRQSSSDRERGQ